MKKAYMTRLEYAARWRLPRQEAEDVIADYRDIAGSPPRSDEELRRDLGRPRDVVKPLAQPKQYRAWLAVFAVMAACLLIPAVSQFSFGLYRLFWPYFPGTQLSLLAGTILVLAWSRPRRGERKAALPRAIPITLAVLLALIAFSWWIFWQLTLFPGGALTNPIFHLSVYIPIGHMSYSANLLHLLLAFELPLLAVVGMTGLVRARLGDRRWLAAYVLSLSALLLALRVISILTSMDPSATLESLFAETMPVMIEIMVVGLLGTGVALC